MVGKAGGFWGGRGAEFGFFDLVFSRQTQGMEARAPLAIDEARVGPSSPLVPVTGGSAVANLLVSLAAGGLSSRPARRAA